MNARSLIPKLASFRGTLEELGTDIAIVTETWCQDDNPTRQVLADFENKNDLSIIRRDRRTGTKGGGVAICSDNTKISMSRARIPHSKHEVAAAIGRRTGQRRKVLVIAAYLPPWYNAAQNTSFYNYINDCITLLLSRYEEPYVILAGDFNRRDISRATGNFPSLKIIRTPPTRGDAILDLVSANMDAMLIDAGVTDPITNDYGVPSDHKTVFFSFRMPRVPQYKIEKYAYHQTTNKGDVLFGQWLVRQGEMDWKQITECRTTDQMVEALHQLFREAMDACYELKTRVKKTSEPVWMADWIRTVSYTHLTLPTTPYV